MRSSEPQQSTEFLTFDWIGCYLLSSDMVGPTGPLAVTPLTPSLGVPVHWTSEYAGTYMQNAIFVCIIEIRKLLTIFESLVAT